MPPHEDRLLAEQVGLGLLGERRLEDAGPRRADRPAVRQDAVAGGPGLVAMDREQRRNAAAGTVDGAQQMARALGRDHPDIDDARRVDAAEPDVEAVGEHQEVARPQVRGDLVVVDRLLGSVRDEDHDHVGRLDGVGDVADLQARVGRERPALGPGSETDDHVDARLVEVQGVGMALAAIPDDRDGLPGERRRVSVVVVVDPRSHRFDRLLDGSRAPGHDDRTRADQFLDAVGAHERHERVDFALGPRDLHDDRPLGDVDDAAARQLDELETSARVESDARILTRASSCWTVGSLVTSWTLRTSISR